MYLFITSTTYAQRLPGDERGFVSKTYDGLHNQYGEDIDADIPRLKNHVERHLKSKPILLNGEQAKVLFEQFQETVAHRHWTLYGVAIMPNHVHILLETSDDTEPEKAAGTLKSYGSRRLNAIFGRPESGTWWTDGSSTPRKTADAIPDLIRYIKNQRNALLVWIGPKYDVE